MRARAAAMFAERVRAVAAPCCGTRRRGGCLSRRRLCHEHRHDGERDGEPDCNKLAASRHASLKQSISFKCLATFGSMWWLLRGIALKLRADLHRRKLLIVFTPVQTVGARP